MPGPVSRIVTHTRSRAASASVVMSIRRVGRCRSATACSALIRMLSSACCSSSGSPEHRRQVLALRCDASRCRAARACACGWPARASARDRLHPLARHALRAGEDQQVADDLRRAIGFLVDPPQLAPDRRVPPPMVSISSSRCPSTPCSGLFISCAMPATNCPSDASFSDCASRSRSASRSASSRVCRVMSRATSTRPIGCAVLVDERRRRQQERAAEARVLDRPRARRAVARRRIRRLDPGARLGADELARADVR